MRDDESNEESQRDTGITPRRQFLTALGVGAAVGVAGCQGGADTETATAPSSETDAQTATATPTDSDTPTDPDTPSETATEQPGVGELTYLAPRDADDFDAVVEQRKRAALRQVLAVEEVASAVTEAVSTTAYHRIFEEYDVIEILAPREMTVSGSHTDVSRSPLRDRRGGARDRPGELPRRGVRDSGCDGRRRVGDQTARGDHRAGQLASDVGEPPPRRLQCAGQLQGHSSVRRTVESAVHALGLRAVRHGSAGRSQRTAQLALLGHTRADRPGRDRETRAVGRIPDSGHVPHRLARPLGVAVRPELGAVQVPHRLDVPRGRDGRRDLSAPDDRVQDDPRLPTVRVPLRSRARLRRRDRQRRRRRRLETALDGDAGRPRRRGGAARRTRRRSRTTGRRATRRPELRAPVRPGDDRVPADTPRRRTGDAARQAVPPAGQLPPRELPRRRAGLPPDVLFPRTGEGTHATTNPFAFRFTMRAENY